MHFIKFHETVDVPMYICMSYEYVGKAFCKSFVNNFGGMKSYFNSLSSTIYYISSFYCINMSSYKYYYYKDTS